MMEQVKAFFKHVYGYFTDEQNEGDFMKICGAALMVVAMGRFAFGMGFDAVAFGAGAGAFAVTKALDKIPAKSV